MTIQICVNYPKRKFTRKTLEEKQLSRFLELNEKIVRQSISRFLNGRAETKSARNFVK